MSTKRKRSVLSIKDKQIIISRLDKGEKGTNLAPEFGISKQQISDIRKNKDKILKFTDNIETSEGLKRKSLKLANDEQLDQALYIDYIRPSHMYLQSLKQTFRIKNVLSLYLLFTLSH